MSVLSDYIDVTVLTPKGKLGKIVSIDRGNVIIRIDGTNISLTYSEQEIIEANELEAKPVKEQPPTKSVDPGPINLDLMSVEALRFGLVPECDLKNFTLGYEETEQWVLSRLPTKEMGGKSASQINGPFGTGKSHTMALIRQIAQKKGFLVAKVEVDGSQVTLHDPASLLTKLWQSLSGNDLPINNPLIELYKKSIDAGGSGYDLLESHRASTNFSMVGYLKRENMLDHFDEKLDSFLSGDKQYAASHLKKDIRKDFQENKGYRLPKELDIKPIIGRYVSDRSSDFIKSLVSNSLIAKKAGYRGIVVTIDEFEVESWWQWTEQVEKRKRDLIEAICEHMGSPQKNSSLGFFFATAGQDEHEGDEIIEEIINNSPGKSTWHLNPWGQEPRSQLAHKIFDLYKSAYELEAGFKNEWLGKAEEYFDNNESNIRAFIKRFVGELDREFGPPNQLQ